MSASAAPFQDQERLTQHKRDWCYRLARWKINSWKYVWDEKKLELSKWNWVLFQVFEQSMQKAKWGKTYFYDSQISFDYEGHLFILFNNTLRSISAGKLYMNWILVSQSSQFTLGCKKIDIIATDLNQYRSLNLVTVRKTFKFFISKNG